MPHQASQDDCASANEVRSPKAWYAHPSRHCTGLLPASTAGADLPSAIANSRAEPQPRCGIACHELDTQTSAKDRTPLGATLGRARPSTRPVTSHMARALAHPRLGGVRCPPRTAASPTPPAEHSHRQLLRLQFIFNSARPGQLAFCPLAKSRRAGFLCGARAPLPRSLALCSLPRHAGRTETVWFGPRPGPCRRFRPAYVFATYLPNFAPPTPFFQIPQPILLRHSKTN